MNDSVHSWTWSEQLLILWCIHIFHWANLSSKSQEDIITPTRWSACQQKFFYMCKRQRKEESRGKTKGGQIKYKYKEKRKKEKFYVDTELQEVREENRAESEAGETRSRRGFVLKALQLIDRMRACLAIQGRVSCHWRGTEDWRGRMKNATQTEEVCMPTFLYLSSSLSVHAASLSGSFFRDSKRWMEVGLLGTLTVLYLLCYVSFHRSEWLRQFILMVTVTAFYCTRGSQHFLAFK